MTEAPVEPGAAGDELEFDLVAATSTRSELILPTAPSTKPGSSGELFELELAAPPPRRFGGPPAARVSQRPPVARASERPSAARASEPPPARPSSPPARVTSPLSERPPARGSVPPSAREIDPLDFLEDSGGRAGQAASSWNGVDAGASLLDWEFDEVLGGGGAPVSALDVAAGHDAAPEASDEGPWPTGQLVEPEEITASPEELRSLSGYGPAPAGWVSAPSYFWRVLRARPAAQARHADTAKELSVAQARLDERLAHLAESKRAELAERDRFMPLYEQVTLHEQRVAASESSWRETNSEGAALLASLDGRIQEARRLVNEEHARLEQRRLEAERQEREAARARAALQRLSIERRNLQEVAARRSSPDGEVPAELNRKYQEVSAAGESAEARLRVVESELLGAKRELAEAEERWRRARAGEQRLEGEKESRSMAFEDRHASSLQELEAARSSRTSELARSGRVILELRGEVPVDRALREEIDRLEKEVVDRLRRKVALERAVGSFDEAAFARGRTAVCAAVALVLLALAWLLWG